MTARRQAIRIFGILCAILVLSEAKHECFEIESVCDGNNKELLCVDVENEEGKQQAKKLSKVMKNLWFSKQIKTELVASSSRKIEELGGNSLEHLSSLTSGQEKLIDELTEKERRQNAKIVRVAKQLQKENNAQCRPTNDCKEGTLKRAAQGGFVDQKCFRSHPDHPFNPVDDCPYVTDPVRRQGMICDVFFSDEEK